MKRRPRDFLPDPRPVHFHGGHPVALPPPLQVRPRRSQDVQTPRVPRPGREHGGGDPVARRRVGVRRTPRPRTARAHVASPRSAAAMSAVRPRSSRASGWIIPRRNRASRTPAWPREAASAARRVFRFRGCRRVGHLVVARPRRRVAAASSRNVAPRSRRNSNASTWPFSHALSSAALTCASRIFVVDASGAGPYAASMTRSRARRSPSLAACRRASRARRRVGRRTRARWSAALAAECATPRFQLPGVPPPRPARATARVRGRTERARASGARTRARGGVPGGRRAGRRRAATTRRGPGANRAGRRRGGRAGTAGPVDRGRARRAERVRERRDAGRHGPRRSRGAARTALTRTRARGADRARS